MQDAGSNPVRRIVGISRGREALDNGRCRFESCCVYQSDSTTAKQRWPLPNVDGYGQGMLLKTSPYCALRARRRANVGPKPERRDGPSEGLGGRDRHLKLNRFYRRPVAGGIPPAACFGFLGRGWTFENLRTAAAEFACRRLSGDGMGHRRARPCRTVQDKEHR